VEKSAASACPVQGRQVFTNGQPRQSEIQGFRLLIQIIESLSADPLPGTRLALSILYGCPGNEEPTPS
jgi:hypothetical protein